MKIKDIKKEERPIERLIAFGSEYLSNEELLAIIINTGYKNVSSKDLALKILNLNSDDLNLNSLLSIKGIGIKKAATILALIEFSKRSNQQIKTINNVKFTSSKMVFDYYKTLLQNKKQEYFYCLYLDNKNKIIEDKLLFIGTINYSIVHPREIIKNAYLLSATSIICVHNHPSLNSNPSQEDITVTKRIKEVCLLCGINFLDHIIIGSDYYSFYEKNDII